MTDEEKFRAEQRSIIFKALAHPSRIFIVEKIQHKPHCVCELARMIVIDQSTTSKHLSVLKNAGIIEDKKNGTTVYYSLKYNCIMKFIGCIENVIRQNMENAFKFYLNSKIK